MDMPAVPTVFLGMEEDFRAKLTGMTLYCWLEIPDKYLF